MLMGLLSDAAPIFAAPTEPPAGVLARSLGLSGEDTVLVLLREQGAAAQEIRRQRLPRRARSLPGISCRRHSLPSEASSR